MENTAPKPLEKVPELWFEDADVIFQAGHKLFRVHRSILSARSPIFKDLFTLPRAGNSVDESYEDCTLIHLPDREIDVHHFFKAIFDASFFERSPAVVSVVELLSIFRLSHKYDVNFLKRRSIVRLNDLFPTEFEDEEKSTHEHLRKCHLTHSTGASIRVDYGLEFMAAARECDTLWVIPAAMAASMQRPLKLIFMTQTWRGMSDPLQESYLIARESFERSRRRSTAWVLIVPARACRTVFQCNSHARGLMERMLSAATESLVGIVPQPARITWTLLQKDLCEKCVDACVAERVLRRKTLWEELPALNGLPLWTELNKQKEKYLA